MDSDLIDELIVALTDNIHLEKLLLANIKFSEDHAYVSECDRNLPPVGTFCLPIQYVSPLVAVLDFTLLEPDSSLS